MPSRPSEPLFLERQSYRRRRLMDAARLLPVVGLMLFLFPLLWAGPAGDAATAMGGVFIFGVWTLLILAAAGLSRRLILTDDPNGGPDAP